MIYHLNELAIDYRKACIEEFNQGAINDFLNEVQRVYSSLDKDDQVKSVELWIGFTPFRAVIDTYHYNNFYPIINLKDYLTVSNNQVQKLYGELYRFLYSHKTTFEDFARDYLL